jgi:hypothetical protein
MPPTRGVKPLPLAPVPFDLELLQDIEPWTLYMETCRKKRSARPPRPSLAAEVMQSSSKQHALRLLLRRIDVEERKVPPQLQPSTSFPIPHPYSSNVAASAIALSTTVRAQPAALASQPPLPVRLSSVPALVPITAQHPHPAHSDDGSQSARALAMLQKITSLDPTRHPHRLLAQLRHWHRRFPPQIVASAVAEHMANLQMEEILQG